ncbi:14737_t:CDS:2, partial [Gigaspora rosea]
IMTLCYLHSHDKYINDQNYADKKHPDCAIGARHRKDLVGPKEKHSFDDFLNQNSSFTVLGQGRLIVSNDPRTVEHILKTNFDDYPKGEIFYEIANDIFGDGIFSVNGKFQISNATNFKF